MLTLDKIYHASYVLKGHIRYTDLIHSSDICPGTDLYLKTENLQVTGAFKIRGAFYKISQLSEDEKSRGVIACSAGNHAQGVALASTRNGIKYGAQVKLVDGTYDDAYEEALRLYEKEGYTFIHPFDDEDVIAGQGTIGLEILEQLPDVECVIVPIGGGGLISGVAMAVKKLNPNVKVYGVQASGAPSMQQAIAKGERITLDTVSTIADGIAVKTPGELTYELCSKYVDEVVTVTDDEISSAILTLIEQQKLITEGAGAVAVAAAMFNKVPIEGKKTVCLLSGGNIDVNILSRVIKRGLLKSGRTYALNIELIDKPGQLKGVSSIIAETGANVIAIHHERADANSDINGCYLRVVMETRNYEHIEQVRSALKNAGYKIS